MQHANLVRYQKKALDVYVVTHVGAQLKGEYGEGVVRLKFDESQQEAHAWMPSTDYQALFSHGANYTDSRAWSIRCQIEMLVGIGSSGGLPALIRRLARVLLRT